MTTLRRDIRMMRRIGNGTVDQGIAKPANIVLAQYPQYARGEVSRIAREIYEQDIKAKVEPEHRGKYLMLDILTGAYEIDEDDVTVSKQAAEKFPNGVRYGMRIGYPASGRI